MKRRPAMTDGAAERWTRQRMNPWAGMTPEILARAFDEFDAGWLRRAALIWENRAERDEVLAGTVPKRCASVSRLPWAVIAAEESPRAERHARALEDFYNSRVEATDALDLDQRGGMRLLIEQMMDAAFTGKQPHEIIWRPGRHDVAAELRAVPLYFFEQLSGRLRYTGPEPLTRGRDLEPGGWMVTARRRRLMKAALMCALMKSMSLTDWMSYSGRFGQPGIHGEIDAAPDSAEWAQFEAAVAAFAQEWAMVSRTGAKIHLIEAGGNPNAPFEPMVERMSRLITMLCRGADLGTMSSKDGAGATLQADESNLLLADDCQMVSESLQRYLSRPVIMHLFGEEPLAYVEIQVPADADTAQEIAVDDAMARWRIAQDPASIAERYGRTIASAKATTPAENDAAVEADPMPALAGLLRQAIAGPARTKLYAAIRELLTDPEGDDDALVEGLEQLRARLPEFLVVDPEAELAFERFAAAATLQGWGDAGGDSVAAENARWNERHPQGTPRSGPVAGGRFAPGKGTSREAKTKPASDQFGPLPAKHVPLTPDQNAARARLAIQFAMSGGGRVAGRAVIRDELGGVDFPYGVPGSPEKQYSDGYGLSHIDAKHPGALNRLPDVISRGDVYEHDVEPDKKRYVILGNEIAIVKRKGGGRAAGWIATSYEENPKKVALYKEAKRVTSRF